jgi:hypothetical protein
LEEERTMVTFTAGPRRFTYRVGAIVIRDGYVLLTRNLSEDYWFTPGGRVEIGEIVSISSQLASTTTSTTGIVSTERRLALVGLAISLLANSDQHHRQTIGSSTKAAFVHCDLIRPNSRLLAHISAYLSSRQTWTWTNCD